MKLSHPTTTAAGSMRFGTTTDGSVGASRPRISTVMVLIDDLLINVVGMDVDREMRRWRGSPGAS
jgi:hypothetical protein